MIALAAPHQDGLPLALADGLALGHRPATTFDRVEAADDIELVRAMARGDRDAFAQLYDRFSPLLMAVSMRVLGDRREAEDLIHDVFLEAWRQIADYDPARGTVRAWLLVRARSRALDRRKSAAVSRTIAVDPERFLEAAADEPEDAATAPDRTTVRRLLTELGDEQRAVLELGYFEGLSSAEIAERLGLPIGTVKSRVAAALAKLRAGLSEGGQRRGTVGAAG